MARKKKSRRTVKEKASEAVPDEKKAVSKKSRTRTCRLAGRNILLTLIIIAVVAAASWTAGSMLSAGGPASADAGSDVVGEKVVTFLQSRLAPNYPGIKVELSDVQDYENLSDTYQVNVKITYNGRTQEDSFYASKDGKSLFNIIGNLDEEIEAPAEDNTQQNTGDVCSQLGVTKSDRPVFELYIFSFCAGGNGGLSVAIPVARTFADTTDFRVRFFSNMHGEHEKQENMIQECIQEVAPDKYLDYAEQYIQKIFNARVCGRNDVDCINEKSTELMDDLGIDSAAVMKCVTENGEQLYAADKAKAGELQLRFSPSFVINGKYVDVDNTVGRTPDGVKKALCCAFNNPPDVCNQVIEASTTQSSGSCA